MIDYNKDIGPHAKLASGMGEYFPSAYPVGGMRASDVRRMVTNYAENIAPLEDRLIAMETDTARLRAQDIAFKRAQISYSQEQEKFRLQKQYTDPAAFNRVDEILGSESGPLQQAEELHEFARKNPQQLAYNPVLAAAHKRALYQVDARKDLKDKQEAPMRTKSNALIGSLRADASNFGDKTSSDLSFALIDNPLDVELQALAQDHISKRHEERAAKRLWDELQGDQAALAEKALRPLRALVDEPDWEDRGDLKDQLVDAAKQITKGGPEKRAYEHEILSEEEQDAWVKEKLRTTPFKMKPDYRHNLVRMIVEYDAIYPTRADVNKAFPKDDALLDRASDILRDLAPLQVGQAPRSMRVNPIDQYNIGRASTRNNTPE